jgi:hypothetical protein
MPADNEWHGEDNASKSGEPRCVPMRPRGTTPSEAAYVRNYAEMSEGKR